MRSKFWFVFVGFVLLACITILPYCHSYQSNVPAYHQFLNTDDFKKLSRTNQVLKCAGCHKQEFESEKIGPHANAYQKLKDHRTFVNGNKYECDFYMRRVNRDFENCAGCHAPKNLWQTMLYDTLNNTEKIITRLMNIEHPMPQSRKNDTMRATSVDCFSCHYDGKNMLSLNHIATADDSVVSKQTFAVIVGNNITCYPCHGDITKTIDAKFAIKKTGAVLCNNCHQEYNAAGKGTHYYYWKHNPTDHVNPHLADILNDWHFDITPGKQSGEITWINNTMPHKMSDGPELIFKCEVLDKDSHVLGSKTIRANNKEHFDKEMYKQVEQHNLYGENGEQVSLDGTPLKYTMALKKGSASTFRITLIDKAQYWFPDSLGTVTAVRTVNLR